MTENTGEDVHRLYANTIPFPLGNLSILQFWYLGEGPATNFTWIQKDNCILSQLILTITFVLIYRSEKRL